MNTLPCVMDIRRVTVKEGILRIVITYSPIEIQILYFHVFKLTMKPLHIPLAFIPCLFSFARLIPSETSRELPAIRLGDKDIIHPRSFDFVILIDLTGFV